MSEDNVIETINPSDNKEGINKLVKLDPQSFEITINISPTDDKEVWVSARLKKPTLEQDFNFAKKSGAEYKEVSSREEQIILSDQGASEKLFDKIADIVKGYRLPEEPKDAAEQWRDAEVIKGKIPGSHKAAFIRGLRVCTARYVGGDDECFVLGGDGTLSVELIIGHESAPMGVVKFEVPEPSEVERQEFENSAMAFIQGKGSKRRTARTYTDMQVCAEFFNKLMLRSGASIEGGRVGEQTFDRCETPASKAAFIAHIDPVYKVRVVGAALVKYAARLQD